MITALPSAERRSALMPLVEGLVTELETDAAELRRLVRSYLRRPQQIFLRELLRSGPARRTPLVEAAWKQIRKALLPHLEKGELTDSELAWVLSWTSRLAITRLKLERPPMVTGASDAPAGPGGRPGAPFGGRDRGGPFPGRGGPFGDRDRGAPFGGRDRGGPGSRPGRDDRRPPGGPGHAPGAQAPRDREPEPDDRWSGLKKFRFDEGS